LSAIQGGAKLKTTSAGSGDSGAAKNPASGRGDAVADLMNDIRNGRHQLKAKKDQSPRKEAPKQAASKLSAAQAMVNALARRRQTVKRDDDSSSESDWDSDD
jgi:type IV secretory pathway TrbL component